MVVRIATKLTVLDNSINQYLTLINISASLTVNSNIRQIFQDTGGSYGFGVQKRV